MDTQTHGTMTIPEMLYLDVMMMTTPLILTMMTNHPSQHPYHTKNQENEQIPSLDDIHILNFY